MAYDQGYYQAPQRPYNSRAAQPPVQQYPPARGYQAQGPYELYPLDEYSVDESSGSGYPQPYDKQYQQYPRNGRGTGAPYPPQQTQGYPSQQDFYGNGRGRGGGDPRIQNMSNMNSGRGVGPGTGPRPYGLPSTAHG